MRVYPSFPAQLMSRQRWYWFVLGPAQAFPLMHGGSVDVTEFTGPILSLQNAPRTVIGYHGGAREAVERIFAEQQFIPSTQAYDWLGEGFYFVSEKTVEIATRYSIVHPFIATY